MTKCDMYAPKQKNCEFAGECLGSRYSCKLLGKGCVNFKIPNRNSCYSYIMFKKAEVYGH